MKFPKVSERVFLIGLVLVNLALRLFRINDPSFAYFDESKFYLPAAREILAKGVDPIFEHPPVSKLLFALSIQIFGDNSLGWRFFPIIFSVTSVVVVYLLAKKLFNDKKMAALAAILFSLDFGWFTTSRLAIPEIIFASLLLLSSYFLVCVFKDKDDNSQRINLFLSSVFFGLSLATKWSALFALPILLVLLAYTFRKQVKVMIFALFFFLVLGGLVYLASYSSYLQKHSPKDLLVLQEKMVIYHNKTVNEIVSRDETLQKQERQYKAVFWPLNNIFSYRFEKIGDSIKGIVFFYNPLLLWGALVAAIFLLARTVNKKEFSLEKLFLAAAFLVFWILFIFSPRIVYPYYWLAGVPFGVILFAKFLVEKNKKSNQVILGFTITAVLLFLLYYPILSNMPVKINYFRILTGTIGFD